MRELGIGERAIATIKIGSKKRQHECVVIELIPRGAYPFEAHYRSDLFRVPRDFSKTNGRSKWDRYLIKYVTNAEPYRRLALVHMHEIWRVGERRQRMPRSMTEEQEATC